MAKPRTGTLSLNEENNGPFTLQFPVRLSRFLCPGDQDAQLGDLPGEAMIPILTTEGSGFVFCT